MHNPSLYRVCGNALACSAVCFIVAPFLAHPPRAIGLAALTASVSTASTMGFALEALGVALALAGVFGLAQHLSDSPGAGWALLALTTFALGAVSIFVADAFSALAERALALMAAASAAPPATLEPAQAAIYTLRRATLLAGMCAAWIALVPLGVAMLADAAFSRFLAWCGIALGLVELGAIFLVRHEPIPSLVILLLGEIYVALLGVTFARLARPVPAAAARVEPVAP